MNTQVSNFKPHILCLAFCILFVSLYSAPAFGAWEKWLGLPVVGVDYRCSGEFSQDEVSKATVIQVGDVYSRSAVRDSIKNIYSLGGFFNVEVDAQSAQNGVFLTFILTRKTKTGDIYLVKPLFNITIENQIDLDSKRISRGLRREFEDNGSSLPRSAGISVKEKSRSWLIDDTYSEKKYFVRRDGDKLDVYLIGTKKLTRDEIIEVMKLKPGQEYDDSIAKMDVESIKRLYSLRGYFNADIAFLSLVSDESEQADVIFSISEGEKSVVREIVCIGTNEAVTETKMLSKIDLKFQSDLDSENISIELRRKLKDKGISLSDKAAISIEKAGRRWLITDIRQVYSIRKEGDKLNIYRTKSLLKAMEKIRLGEIYEDQQALDSDAELIEEMHRQAGYITAKIKNAQAIADPGVMEEYRGKGTHFAVETADDGGVMVVIEIEQGRKVYVKIEGNKHIKDDGIKRAIAVGRMYSISESVLRKSDEDIKKLYKAKGYYNVSVKHKVFRDEVWNFYTDGDSEGWEPLNESTSLGVSDRILRISSDDVPQIKSPTVNLNSSIYHAIQIRMRTGEGSVGGLYWTTDKSDKWDKKRRLDFDVISDGLFHDYRINMLHHDNWSDTITRLGLHLVDVPGADVDISSIKVITESITVVFEVTENQLIRIGDISIVTPGGGKPEVDEKKIKKQMLTRKRHLLSRWWLKKYLPDGIFDEIVFETDLRAIVVLYKDKGYPEAKIVDKKIDTEKGKIDISITISEGPRTTVTAVVLESDHKNILDNKEILSRLAVFHGFDKQDIFIEASDPPRVRCKEASPVVFREEDTVEARSYLRTRYADEGYLYAQIETIKQFNDDLTEVIVTYRVTKGKKVRIDGEIEIRGNDRTKRSVIERELSDRLTQDRVFSYTEIAKSWQRLLDSGLFETVRIDTEPVAGSEELVKMIVEVTERKAISINMHVGFGSSEDFRFGTEATHINLWGTGRKLGGKAQIGIEGTRGEINYTRPRLLSTGAHGLMSLYKYSEKDYKDYSETRTGGTVGIKQSLHRINTLTYRYRYDQVKYEDEDKIERTTNIGRIETAFQRDTRRDSPLNPRRGWLNVLMLEYANSRLGGSETFARFMLNSNYYSPLSQNIILALSARTGYAWGLGGTKRVLTPEQFDLSDYTIPRGYNWEAKDASTAMIGNLILNTSIEIRFPIYKWIGGAAFFDSGCVCNEASDFSIRLMKSAVGVGLRFATPIGPARLDYGYPIRGDGNRNYWPHIAIGHAF